LTGILVSVVQDTLQPDHASLWLKPHTKVSFSGKPGEGIT
jgi:hypothetical protein